MAEKKLGVLVHGAGWVSGQHIAAFSSNPHAEVVAISSRKLTSCQARAEETGLASGSTMTMSKPSNMRALTSFLFAHRNTCTQKTQSPQRRQASMLSLKSRLPTASKK